MRIPKPYPDRDAGHYFSVAATPAINRTVDDCLPRSQMKRLFEEGKIGVDTIGDFCKEYLVDERVAQDYLNHLQLLSAKVLQRKQNRLEAAAARQSRTYEAYDWSELYKQQRLSSLLVSELRKYISHHKLAPERKKLNKKALQLLVESHISSCLGKGSIARGT